MDIICDRTKCCGCHACYNICPKNAVEMITDEKGFKYPVINQKKCINCGLCVKVCPILKNNVNKYQKKVYAIYNKNEEERLNSSSGGLFILLAKAILNMNGVVFGASFDKDFCVFHSYVEDENEIIRLQGSKYVQSTIGDTYKKVKEFLEKDIYVLFTGTSCQIEGLKSFLIKDYDKLYTQDLICHGVPSPKVWQKYLDYQKKIYKNNDIKNISFRNKAHSWSLFSTRIDFNGKVYSKTHDKDLFMQAFLSNTCLRESCYNCHFKNDYRNSDITLADFWGVSKVHPNMNDEKGTSLVIINSRKGQELFDLIKTECKYEVSYEDIIYLYNPAYIRSAIKDKKYDAFYENIDKMEFDILVKKYVSHISIFKKLIRKTRNIIKKVLDK